MDKRLQLKDIIKKCEQKFGRGNSESWKHNDFHDFSREISEKTKINISHNTLKRIFGKIPTDKYYLPQQATFDALIEYSDFDISTQYDEKLDFETPLTDSVNIDFESKTRKKYKAGGFLILLFIFAVLGYWVFKNDTFNGDISDLKLTSSEGTLPKTCFFAINTPNVSDSVFIDFGDRSPLVHLKPNQKTVSHTYFIPGVFDVAITDRTTEFAKSSVYIETSKKWLGLGFQKQRLIPKNYYAFQAQKNKDSLFSVTNSQLERNSIDTTQTFFVRLCNYAPISQSADNFIFETTFKKDFTNEGIFCSGMVFKISGANNKIRFNFVNSGCSSKVTNIISEKMIDGVTHNLTPFVIDFKKWNTVKLINNNKKLSLFVNDTLIHKTTYDASLGDLRGLFVEFERNGIIKKCSLSSLSGTKYYSF